MASPTIVLLGTCDSKLDELLFVRAQIELSRKYSVLLIDLGRHATTHDRIDVPQSQLLGQISRSASTDTDSDFASLSKAGAFDHIVACATKYVQALFDSDSDSGPAKRRPHGIIGIGGSSGTTMATAVMRHGLPVGVPKLMVSTMASGDTRPYVEDTDITMMYSVVDIAGINSILGPILRNAAGAIVGMAEAYGARRTGPERPNDGENDNGVRIKRVAVTMFGVTTPCVDVVRRHLVDRHAYEVYVFHATGAGGKAMERLIREKQIDAVLDLTTTEIADELVGGVLSAGPDRLRAAAEAGIPQVLSFGACDMVNFGPRETVPSHFQSRRLHEHNATVTLMRTSVGECTRIGEHISNKLRRHTTRPDLIQVIMPEGGISIISVAGQPFHDPEADSALFHSVEMGLKDSGIQVIRDRREINDAEFAVSAAEALVRLIQKQKAGTHSP